MADPPDLADRASTASIRWSAIRTALSASIQGGAAPAFRSTWKAIAHSPAASSSSNGIRSPWYGRSSNFPSSIASRSWRSTRLSQVGATCRRPSASRRLAGRRAGG
jgi:hypothetical protein